MSEPSLAIQGALVALLKSSGPSGDLGVADRIYDRPPADVQFPYIRVGDDQTVGDDDDCEELSEVFCRIHVWSQAAGKPEAKTIAGAVRAAIRAATWSLPGFAVDNVQFVQTLYLDDPDGISTHAVIEVRFLITHS